ncbi:protein-tyrosine phosphatase-like protein, partial [Gorgonomyces haynaldii]
MRPTLVEHKSLKHPFLITDCPQPDMLTSYLQLLRDNKIQDLVRISEPTYDAKQLEGIRIHELQFTDGGTPPKDILDKWRQLTSKQQGPIAVHCVSGIGRAPLMVCIALIDQGMDPLDAVTFIRQQRRGAINKVQLQFLESLKKKSWLQ